MSSIERWLPVAGYEGLYEVSDLGRVRSVARMAVGVNRRVPERILTSSWRGRYLAVSMHSGLRQKNNSVHLLVLAAFVGPRPEDQEGRHLDGDRSNNRLPNLAWGTKLENEADKDRHGRRPRGASVNRQVLDDTAVRRIISLEGTAPLRVIADAVGCGLSTAHHVLTGRTWGWLTGRSHQQVR